MPMCVKYRPFKQNGRLQQPLHISLYNKQNTQHILQTYPGHLGAA